jgi:GGDEF domain-containing protein
MPVGIEAGPQRPVHQAVRLASLAVVNHHSKVALQWEASHDALTGLKNRAGFENDLATDIAARIIDAVSLPISVAGHTVVVGASVGLAMDHGTMDRSSLFERADQALYDAKVGGKQQLAMAP